MLLENPFGAAPLTLLGLTGSGAPVYALAGAEPDTDIEVEPDDETGEEGTEDQEEGAESGSSGDDEKEKLRASLKKANAEARRYRLQVREMQKAAGESAVEEAEAEAEEKGTELTPAQLKRAVDKARKEATEAAEAKYRKVAVNAAAQSAFVKAGAKAASVGKLVRLLDVEDVEIDAETGEVTAGLDDQIDGLKEEFPELFAPAEPQKPAKKAAPKRASAAPRQEAAEQPKSTAEKMADAILGR